jgi:outer membrane protein TolC
MSLQLPRWLRFINVLAFSTAAMIATRGHAEPLPLDRAIRIALAHSTTSAIAGAEVQRAFASYRELRNNYIPQVAIGSGFGWPIGNPIALGGGAPAWGNAVAQSTIFNPAQRQFINAAKTEWHASEFQDKDQRNAVIQDVALTYAELVKWEARLKRLQHDEAEAKRMEQAVAERLQEGVDSTMDLNKARLTSARVRLRRTEARGSADVLRRHLATLTGLPVSSIELEPETIPALPPVAPEEEDLSEKAVAASPAIRIAEQHSLAEAIRALGEHRSLLPSVEFNAQYARLSTINNYSVYFAQGKFQPDAATIAFALRIPLFNASQRARSDAADAEALKAKKQAEATRNQVAEETLRLQRAAEQLQAAREVAELEYQLAQSSLEAVQTRVDAKTGTLHELGDARVQAGERFLFFQDADFEYQRARMNLLRATGDLEAWALPHAAADPAPK